MGKMRNRATDPLPRTSLLRRDGPWRLTPRWAVSTPQPGPSSVEGEKRNPVLTGWARVLSCHSAGGSSFPRFWGRLDSLDFVKAELCVLISPAPEPRGSLWTYKSQSTDTWPNGHYVSGPVVTGVLGLACGRRAGAVAAVCRSNHSGLGLFPTRGAGCFLLPNPSEVTPRPCRSLCCYGSDATALWTTASPLPPDHSFSPIGSPSTVVSWATTFLLCQVHRGVRQSSVPQLLLSAGSLSGTSEALAQGGSE